MYLSPKPQGSTTILVKVIKLPRSLGTFAIFFGLLRNEICRKRKRSPPPQRAREQSLQKISWNGGGDHLALQCHIKSNQLKHNGAFLPPCTVFYALWSWPLFGIAIALLEMLDTSTLASSTLKITKCSNLCNFLFICLCAIILLKKIFLCRTNDIGLNTVKGQ